MQIIFDILIKLINSSLFGIFIGLFIAEYFRRKRRIEDYSNVIFNKRFKAYEKLFQFVSDSQDLGREILETDKYNQEERHKRWMDLVLCMDKFTDDNALYLNEEISFHCVACLAGVDSIPEKQDIEEKREAIRKFHDDIKNAKQMIKDEIGLTQVEKVFRKISKSKPKSDRINYHRDLAKHIEKLKKH